MGGGGSLGLGYAENPRCQATDCPEITTFDLLHVRWSSWRKLLRSNNDKRDGHWRYVEVKVQIDCGDFDKYGHKRISTTSTDAPLLRLLSSQTASATNTLTSVDSNRDWRWQSYSCKPPILDKIGVLKASTVWWVITSEKHPEHGKSPEMTSIVHCSSTIMIKFTVFIKLVHAPSYGLLSRTIHPTSHLQNSRSVTHCARYCGMVICCGGYMGVYVNDFLISGNGTHPTNLEDGDTWAD